jgi:hypothetical protein
VTAPAQQTGKIFRIGFLDVSTASSSAVLLEVFRQEMRKLGWIEEKNITIEYRFADQKFERLPELAEDLVRLKVDLIVAPGSKIHFPIRLAMAKSFPVDRICRVCLRLAIADGARFFLRFALIRSVVPVWIQIDVAAISHSSKESDWLT